VNHHLPHIDKILWQFDFIPFSRLDDLMISYAPPGGTVGPHFDSYDVFLLQVGGKNAGRFPRKPMMTSSRMPPSVYCRIFVSKRNSC
jgi:ribosomal protein L16 Arg81 hydroxylase